MTLHKEIQMKNKKCSKCNTLKLVNKFSIRGGKRGNSLQAYCKSCITITNAKQYLNTKNKNQGVHKPHKKYREKCKNFIIKQKDVPCADCDIKYPPYVMQFDHLRDKKYTISQMYTLVGLPTIKAEIQKCEVVCANCHAERTHGRP